MLKTFICLAKSRKHKSFCIAGKEYSSKTKTVQGWFRPISATDNGEISTDDCSYKNGKEPDLLDIIKLEVLADKPAPHQPENFLINDTIYWENIDCFPKEKLASICDSPSTLWKNNNNSKNGIFDRISEEEAKTETCSLYLIKPSSFKIIVCIEFGNKKKVRAEFVYNETTYRFSITDLKIEAQYRGYEIGEYPSSNPPFLCISLGEPYGNPAFCYKLVAGVFL